MRNAVGDFTIISARFISGPTTAIRPRSASAAPGWRVEYHWYEDPLADQVNIYNYVKLNRQLPRSSILATEYPITRPRLPAFSPEIAAGHQKHTCAWRHRR